MLVVGELHELVASAVGQLGQHHEVHDAGVQLVEHLAGGAAVHVVGQVRAALAQAGYLAGQVLDLVRFGQTEVQHAAGDVVQLGEFRLHLVGHGNQALRALAQQTTLLGKRDAEALAHEQLLAQLGFQGLDLLGEGGLSEVQLLGCPGHVLFFGHDEKRSEFAQFHRCSKTFNKRIVDMKLYH